MNPIKLVLGSLLALGVTFQAATADVVVTASGTQTGEVMRVESNGNIWFKTGVAEIKLSKADVLRIDVVKPATYAEAVAALKASKYLEAVAGLKPIVERYAGLTVPWIQDAMLALGDAYLGAKQLTQAVSLFDKIKGLYPDSPLAQALDVKYAHVLVEQNSCGEASAKLKAYLKKMMSLEFLTDVQEMAVAEALALQGDCLQKANKPEDALDSYLLAITLFDLDPDLVAEARYKAGKCFEQIGNWKRAKETYEDLLKEGPKGDFVPDAKQRLEAINKDHSE